jgi:transposase
MEAIVERCCGLDVHQASVVACLIVGPADQRARRETRTFGTTTEELERLRAWLVERGCTHVGMESTGVYWVPVYGVLEGAVDLTVGNAAHIKAVPGRKTDVKDAEWLAELVRHGLIRRSFVPPKWQRALRELLRYRRKLVQSQAAERNRLLKLLELGNIKLATVASNVFGVSGRAMVRALIAGEAPPPAIAQLARGTLRRKLDVLPGALRGRLEPHHRPLLQLQLERIERLEADLAQLDGWIDERLRPHADALARLRQIPGVDRVTAATIIAELGVDMTVFPTARHAAAWTGICPGNNVSAGKRVGQHQRRGNVHLATALVQAAAAAPRAKKSYLREKFWRLKARRGHRRALVAVAHHILVAAYHMLRTGQDYRDLGPGHFERRGQATLQRSLVRRLEALGYTVRLEAKT